MQGREVQALATGHTQTTTQTLERGPSGGGGAALGLDKSSKAGGVSSQLWPLRHRLLTVCAPACRNLSPHPTYFVLAR